MAIVVLTAEDVAGDEYGLLVDAEKERPLPLPLFPSRDAAKDFLDFARHTMRGGHLETLHEPLWARIHQAWELAVCRACWSRSCNCLECGRPCSAKCVPTCLSQGVSP